MNFKRLISILSFFILFVFVTSGCNLTDVLSGDVSITNSELTVSFIDVGQGDATLIECGDQVMLIDAGLYGERYTVTSYIANRGIKNIDYCVATHPHSDHIGGMSQVIYNFNVKNLVYPICDKEKENMNYVLDACDERDVNYINPDIGDTFSLGGATVTVLSPKHKAEYENTNNYSLVLKLEYENVSFLFMGDAESKVEKELLRSGYDLSADILKCGHHGSSTSSSEKFIDAVNPVAAVISCGKNNDYGHPHRETKDTLNKRNIQIYRTDESSHIVACSDGDFVTFYSGDDVLGTAPANTHPATSPEETTVTYSYIGNKNSKIYHYPDCGSIDTIKEKNKVNFISEDEAIDKGYSPCKACNP